MTARTVLHDADIRRALRRIAHEVLESRRGDGRLVFLGIPTRGTVLAERIQRVVDEIEPGTSSVGSLDITLYRDDLARTPTRAPAPTRIPDEGIDDAIVVLVDDVLYSGRTVRAALDALADHGRPRAVRLAVLVDRGHRELPIRADFVGKNLPSSTSERVSVRLADIDGVLDMARPALPGPPRHIARREIVAGQDFHAAFSDIWTIGLRWGEVDEAAGYEVQQRGDEPEDWFTINEEALTSTEAGTQTSYSGFDDTKYFRVRAVFDDRSVSKWSRPFSVRIPATNVLYEVEGTAGSANITIGTPSGSEQASINVPLTTKSGETGLICSFGAGYSAGTVFVRKR